MTELQVRNGYQKLTKTLIEHKLTITTMESATSGQIASLITDTEGASAIFKGAFVTYCNEAKIMQGVPAETIEKYSVYSKETACAMAKACKKSYKADIAIGITGTMGNADPENVSVPGQVFFSIIYGDMENTFFYEIPPQNSRLGYKLEVAGYILNELNKILNFD